MSNCGFTVAVAVNNDEVLRNNLYRSPDILARPELQILTRRGFASASLAHNSALDEASNDVVIFVHQDVYLPQGWFGSLARALADLQREGVDWGVLGCFGSRKGHADGLGRVYTRGLGIHGTSIDCPEIVESLDEIVLIIRKSSGLRFDPSLPHFHLYGTDLCMAASARGLPSFAIPAFCVHNTNQLLTLPREFYECYRYLKRKWARYLPICTSCITISRFDGEVLRRKLHEAPPVSWLARKRTAVRRAGDVADIFAEIAGREEIAEQDSVGWEAARKSYQKKRDTTA